MTGTPFTENDALRLEAHRNYEAIHRVISNLKDKLAEETAPFNKGVISKDIDRLREEARDVYLAAPLEPGQVRYVVFGGEASWHQREAGHYSAWWALFNFTPAEMEAWANSFREKRPEERVYWRELQRSDV